MPETKTSKILLVEDNLDNLELMRLLLDQKGYAVITARTGKQCLKLARAESPDLVLMDLSLPEVDGWTAASELKADPHTQHIPLIAVTAHTLPGDRKRALEAGFDGYISKPINVDLFFGVVEKSLRKSRT